VHGVLLKPVTVNNLATMVRTVLDQGTSRPRPGAAT